MLDTQGHVNVNPILQLFNSILWLINVLLNLDEVLFNYFLIPQLLLTRPLIIFNADIVLDNFIQLLNLPPSKIFSLLAYLFALSKSWGHLKTSFADFIHFEVKTRNLTKSFFSDRVDIITNLHLVLLDVLIQGLNWFCVVLYHFLVVLYLWYLIVTHEYLIKEPRFDFRNWLLQLVCQLLLLYLHIMYLLLHFFKKQRFTCFRVLFIDGFLQ